MLSPLMRWVTDCRTKIWFFKAVYQLRDSDNDDDDSIDDNDSDDFDDADDSDDDDADNKDDSDQGLYIHTQAWKPNCSDPGGLCPN